MSVQRAQFEIPSSEFVDWVVYLDDEPNRFHRDDYNFARLAAEIRRSYVKDPMTVKEESFLIEFREKKKVKKLTIEEKTKRDKKFWGTVLKFSKRKKK